MRGSTVFGSMQKPSGEGPKSYSTPAASEAGSSADAGSLLGDAVDMVIWKMTCQRLLFMEKVAPKQTITNIYECFHNNIPV